MIRDSVPHQYVNLTLFSTTQNSFAEGVRQNTRSAHPHTAFPPQMTHEASPTTHMARAA